LFYGNWCFKLYVNKLTIVTVEQIRYAKATTSVNIDQLATAQRNLMFYRVCLRCREADSRRTVSSKQTVAA